MHDARALAELPTHFLDDRGRGAADRRHAHRGEQIGQQTAEQEADDDIRIDQREVGHHAVEIGMLVGAGDEEFEIFIVGGEQHQRAEAGGADGVALGHRFGGVADGVERVGRLAHLFRQARHFGDAAGIVGDRTEGVERDHDAGQSEHRRHCDGDAEQAREFVADQDAGDDDQRRAGGRFHRYREALDHIGAVAGHRGQRDRVHRPIVGAGVVFGDHDDQAGHHKAGDAAIEQIGAGIGDAGERRRSRSGSG